MNEPAGCRRPSVVLLGATDRSEFVEAAACLAQSCDIAAFDDSDAALRAIATGQVVPELIVVAQAFPGQYSHAAVDRLRQQAPLARFVGLLGSWCEGEMRTGSPWPGVVRTYWHHWPARAAGQLARLAAGSVGSWTLQATASEEERLQADVAGEFPKRQGLVVVRSARREMADWLSAACRSRGFATVCYVTSQQQNAAPARVEGAVAGVFDGTDLSGPEAEGLRRFAKSLAPTPIIALANFPRIEDRRHAKSLGSAMLLSKPLALGDFYWTLDSCLAPASVTATLR